MLVADEGYRVARACGLQRPGTALKSVEPETYFYDQRECGQ